MVSEGKILCGFHFLNRLTLREKVDDRESPFYGRKWLHEVMSTMMCGICFRCFHSRRGKISHMQKFHNGAVEPKIKIGRASSFQRKPTTKKIPKRKKNQRKSWRYESDISDTTDVSSLSSLESESEEELSDQSVVCISDASDDERIHDITVHDSTVHDNILTLDEEVWKLYEQMSEFQPKVVLRKEDFTFENGTTTIKVPPECNETVEMEVMAPKQITQFVRNILETSSKQTSLLSDYEECEIIEM